MSSRGSIHGRFQPFHNGHLDYALAALSHVEFLYVGLTRVLTEPGIGGEIAPHRLESDNNPLTYYQRSQVISRALIAGGVPLDRFSVGPFPIEVPSRLPEFWPLEAECFTTVVDEWNLEKIEVLKSCGYKVHVLENVVREPSIVTSGSRVRELIRAGDRTWKTYVPASTVPLLECYASSF